MISIFFSAREMFTLFSGSSMGFQMPCSGDLMGSMPTMAAHPRGKARLGAPSRSALGRSLERLGICSVVLLAAQALGTFGQEGAVRQREGAVRQMAARGAGAGGKAQGARPRR